MAELKSCKCKKHPEYFMSPGGDHILHTYVCPTCKHFGVGLTDKEAVDDWNKRSVK